MRRRLLVAVAAASVMGCGGGQGGIGVDVPSTSTDDPPAASSSGLPPVSSRYVRYEGKVQRFGNPAAPTMFRAAFERLFDSCNFLRQMYGQPTQLFSDFPEQVLMEMDRFAEEAMYDAATGIGRMVQYQRATIDLTDYSQALDAERAPDCLQHAVRRRVQTTIWGSDGHQYSFSGDSPDLADSAGRSLYVFPDALSWRRLPEADAWGSRQIAGHECRVAPRLHVLVGFVDTCRLDPDGDIAFRNLPISLEEVQYFGTDNGEPTESTDVTTLTPVEVTFDRSRFGRWAGIPLDRFPELAPGVTLTQAP